MISVLMSVYNEHEKELRASIESIIQQTYTDWEMIIVIDNPAYTEAIRIVEFYANADKRIKYVVNSENIGLALSMNVAADLAHGEYIARMDADDISVKNRFEIQIEAINNGYDLVCGSFDTIDEYDHLIKEPGNYYSDKLIEKLLPYGNAIHHPTVIMKASLFNQVGQYRNFICAQDYDLWLRLRAANCKFHMVPETILHYRERSSNITSKRKYIQICTTEYIRNLYKQYRSGKGDQYSYQSYIKYLESRDAFSKDAQDDFFKYRDIYINAKKAIKKGHIIKGLRDIVHVIKSSKHFRPQGWNKFVFEFIKKHTR